MGQVRSTFRVMAESNMPTASPTSSFPVVRRALLRRGVPTALVLAGLALVAYWGHISDWRFFGGNSSHASRLPQERTMWVEAGADRQASTPCAEHGLPGCATCNPGLAQLLNPPRTNVEAIDRTRRAMAARARSIGDPAALRLPRSIRFESADAVDKAGIDIAPAWSDSISETIEGSGELGFEPALYSRLTARAPGNAWRVFKRIGDHVRKGELLALIDAVEVGKAKADLLIALVQMRLKAQAAKDLASALGSATPTQRSGGCVTRGRNTARHGRTGTGESGLHAAHRRTPR